MFREAVKIIGIMGCLLVLAGCVKTDKERALAGGAKQVTAEQMKKLVSGNTVVGIIPQFSVNYTVFYQADGKCSGKISGPVTDDARGTWEVDGSGQLCVTWTKAAWNNGPKCNVWWKQGDEIKVFAEKGGLASKAKVEKGNSKKLEMRSDLELAQAASPQEQVEADFLREKLTGNTVTGELKAGSAKYHAFYGPDGKVSATIPSAAEADKGTYKINDDGKVCVTWSRWLDKQESCGSWYRDGKVFKIYDDGGSLGLTAKIRDGNPEKLKI